ncbi:hypothetical protein V8C86DRAFT_2724849 [Haematococcus lacustris]
MGSSYQHISLHLRSCTFGASAFPRCTVARRAPGAKCRLLAATDEAVILDAVTPAPAPVAPAAPVPAPTPVASEEAPPSLETAKSKERKPRIPATYRAALGSDLTEEQQKQLWTAASKMFTLSNDIMKGERMETLVELSRTVATQAFVPVRFEYDLVGSPDALLEAGGKLAATVSARLLSMSTGQRGAVYLLTQRPGSIEELLALVPAEAKAAEARRAAAAARRRASSGNAGEGPEADPPRRPRQRKPMSDEDKAAAEARAAALAEGKAEYARRVAAKQARREAHQLALAEAAARKAEKQAQQASGTDARKGVEGVQLASVGAWDWSAAELSKLWQACSCNTPWVEEEAASQAGAPEGDSTSTSLGPMAELAQLLPAHALVAVVREGGGQGEQELQQVQQRVEAAGGKLLATKASAGATAYLVTQEGLGLGKEALLEAAAAARQAQLAATKAAHEQRMAEQQLQRQRAKEERQAKHQAWLAASRASKAVAAGVEVTAPASAATGVAAQAPAAAAEPAEATVPAPVAAIVGDETGEATASSTEGK